MTSVPAFVWPDEEEAEALRHLVGDEVDETHKQCYAYLKDQASLVLNEHSNSTYRAVVTAYRRNRAQHALYQKALEKAGKNDIRAHEALLKSRPDLVPPKVAVWVVLHRWLDHAFNLDVDMEEKAEDPSYLLFSSTKGEAWAQSLCTAPLHQLNQVQPTPVGRELVWRVLPPLVSYVLIGGDSYHAQVRHARLAAPFEGSVWRKHDQVAEKLLRMKNAIRQASSTRKKTLVPLAITLGRFNEFVVDPICTAHNSLKEALSAAWKESRSALDKNCSPIRLEMYQLQEGKPTVIDDILMNYPPDRWGDLLEKLSKKPKSSPWDRLPTLVLLVALRFSSRCVSLPRKANDTKKANQIIAKYPRRSQAIQKALEADNAKDHRKIQFQLASASLVQARNTLPPPDNVHPSKNAITYRVMMTYTKKRAELGVSPIVPEKYLKKLRDQVHAQQGVRLKLVQARKILRARAEKGAEKQRKKTPEDVLEPFADLIANEHKLMMPWDLQRAMKEASAKGSLRLLCALSERWDLNYRALPKDSRLGAYIHLTYQILYNAAYALLHPEEEYDLDLQDGDGDLIQKAVDTNYLEQSMAPPPVVAAKPQLHRIRIQEVEPGNMLRTILILMRIRDREELKEALKMACVRTTDESKEFPGTPTLDLVAGVFMRRLNHALDLQRTAIGVLENSPPFTRWIGAMGMTYDLIRKEPSRSIKKAFEPNVRQATGIMLKHLGHLAGIPPQLRNVVMRLTRSLDLPGTPQLHGLRYGWFEVVLQAFRSVPIFMYPKPDLDEWVDLVVDAHHSQRHLLEALLIRWMGPALLDMTWTQFTRTYARGASGKLQDGPWAIEFRQAVLDYAEGCVCMDPQAGVCLIHTEVEKKEERVSYLQEEALTLPRLKTMAQKALRERTDKTLTPDVAFQLVMKVINLEDTLLNITQDSLENDQVVRDHMKEAEEASEPDDQEPLETFMANHSLLLLRRDERVMELLNALRGPDEQQTLKEALEERDTREQEQALADPMSEEEEEEEEEKEEIRLPGPVPGKKRKRDQMPAMQKEVAGLALMKLIKHIQRLIDSSQGAKRDIYRKHLDLVKQYQNGKRDKDTHMRVLATVEALYTSRVGRIIKALSQRLAQGSGLDDRKRARMERELELLRTFQTTPRSSIRDEAMRLVDHYEAHPPQAVVEYGLEKVRVGGDTLTLRTIQVQGSINDNLRKLKPFRPPTPKSVPTLHETYVSRVAQLLRVVVCRRTCRVLESSKGLGRLADLPPMLNEPPDAMLEWAKSHNLIPSRPEYPTKVKFITKSIHDGLEDAYKRFGRNELVVPPPRNETFDARAMDAAVSVPAYVNATGSYGDDILEAHYRIAANVFVAFQYVDRCVRAFQQHSPVTIHDRVQATIAQCVLILRESNPSSTILQEVEQNHLKDDIKAGGDQGGDVLASARERVYAIMESILLPFMMHRLEVLDLLHGAYVQEDKRLNQAMMKHGASTREDERIKRTVTWMMNHWFTYTDNETNACMQCLSIIPTDAKAESMRNALRTALESIDMDEYAVEADAYCDHAGPTEDDVDEKRNDAARVAWMDPLEPDARRIVKDYENMSEGSSDERMEVEDNEIKDAGDAEESSDKDEHMEVEDDLNGEVKEDAPEPSKPTPVAPDGPASDDDRDTVTLDSDATPTDMDDEDELHAMVVDYEYEDEVDPAPSEQKKPPLRLTQAEKDMVYGMHVAPQSSAAASSSGVTQDNSSWVSPLRLTQTQRDQVVAPLSTEILRDAGPVLQGLLDLTGMGPDPEDAPPDQKKRKVGGPFALPASDSRRFAAYRDSVEKYMPGEPWCAWWTDADPEMKTFVHTPSALEHDVRLHVVRKKHRVHVAMGVPQHRLRSHFNVDRARHTARVKWQGPFPHTLWRFTLGPPGKHAGVRMARRWAHRNWAHPCVPTPCVLMFNHQRSEVELQCLIAGRVAQPPTHPDEYYTSGWGLDLSSSLVYQLHARVTWGLVLDEAQRRVVILSSTRAAVARVLSQCLHHCTVQGTWPAPAAPPPLHLPLPATPQVSGAFSSALVNNWKHELPLFSIDKRKQEDIRKLIKKRWGAKSTTIVVSAPKPLTVSTEEGKIFLEAYARNKKKVEGYLKAARKSVVICQKTLRELEEKKRAFQAGRDSSRPAATDQPETGKGLPNADLDKLLFGETVTRNTMDFWISLARSSLEYDYGRERSRNVLYCVPMDSTFVKLALEKRDISLLTKALDEAFPQVTHRERVVLPMLMLMVCVWTGRRVSLGGRCADTRMGG